MARWLVTAVSRNLSFELTATVTTLRDIVL